MERQIDQNSNYESSSDDLLNSMVEQRCWNKNSDNSPMDQLRKALIINSVWGLVISASYVVVFFIYPILIVRIALAVLLLFNAWVISQSYHILRQTQKDVISEKPLLEVMKFYYSSIYNWMNIQKRVSIFVYPISVAGGFVLGGVISSGSVDIFIEKPNLFYWLIGSIVVLVPICYQFANYLFKVAFGTHMERLKTLISQIEKPD